MNRQQFSEHQKPIDRGYDVVARMVQYIRNELDPALHNHVHHSIQNCKSCHELYEEVLDFQKDSVSPQFKNRHKTILKSNERFLNQLIANTKASAGLYEKVPHENENPRELELEYNIDDCLCCGS